MWIARWFKGFSHSFWRFLRISAKKKPPLCLKEGASKEVWRDLFLRYFYGNWIAFYGNTQDLFLARWELPLREEQGSVSRSGVFRGPSLCPCSAWSLEGSQWLEGDDGDGNGAEREMTGRMTRRMTAPVLSTLQPHPAPSPSASPTTCSVIL